MTSARMRQRRLINAARELTGRQAELVRAIAGHGFVTWKEAADAVNCSMSSATHALNSLVAKKLVIVKGSKLCPQWKLNAFGERVLRVKNARDELRQSMPTAANMSPMGGGYVEFVKPGEPVRDLSIAATRAAREKLTDKLVDNTIAFMRDGLRTGRTRRGIPPLPNPPYTVREPCPASPRAPSATPP